MTWQPTEGYKNYTIGVDVGTHSVGISAVEYDGNNPLSILAVASFIHDSGVDPFNANAGDSRNKVSGVARRARRLKRRRVARLKQLDTWLKDNGFPLEDLNDKTYQAWHARADLIDTQISNPDECKKKEVGTL
jgi:CRISPR-associated endonuclease Csn1